MHVSLKNGDDVDKFIHPFFVSKMKMVLLPADIEDKITECYDEIITKFENFLEQGSGYTLDATNYVRLVLVKIKRTLAGGCAGSKLPLLLLKKRAIFNPPSLHGHCFSFAVAGSVLSSKQKKIEYNVAPYNKIIKKFKGNLVWMQFKDFYEFEKNNNIRLTVFGFDAGSGNIYLIYKSRTTRGFVSNILFFENHYYTIRNLKRLAYESRHRRPVFFCQICFVKFTKKNALLNHNKISIAIV